MITVQSSTMRFADSRRPRRFFAFLLLGIVSVLLSVSMVGKAAEWDIDCPYENVEWQSYEQTKANFHTHTDRSDGRWRPERVIQEYHDLDYNVLALTDHNKVTWPWSDFNASADDLDMLAIEGAEPSRHHHMVSLFCDVPGEQSVEGTLSSVREKDGVAFMNHPGRYKNWSTEKYVQLFRKWDMLVGMEIYNQGDRYGGDRKKWDKILTVLMPEGRPVWGFSNDDMHVPKHVGRNWSILLLPSLSSDKVRGALQKGHFFYAYAPQGHEGDVPTIKSIECDTDEGVITIEARDVKKVEWISEGKTVANGSRVVLSEVEDLGSYLRAVVYAEAGDSIVGTQPIGIEETAE